MNDPIHSTGRGGAGNIGPDPSTYADGDIVREGVEGLSSRGTEYSAGRGGAGNIVPSPRSGTPNPSATAASSSDVVPETATRDAGGQHQEKFHTGRGGQGNVHKDKYGGHSSKHGGESLLEKAKHAVGLDGKGKEGSALKREEKP